MYFISQKLLIKKLRELLYLLPTFKSIEEEYRVAAPTVPLHR